MTTYARWNEDLNGISTTDDPAGQPDFTWTELQEVYPPKDDSQIYGDPSLSTNTDHTVFTRTWTVEDAPPPPPPPTVEVEIGALQALVAAVNGLSSLGDAQSYVAGWAAALGA